MEYWLGARSVSALEEVAVAVAGPMLWEVCIGAAVWHGQQPCGMGGSRGHGGHGKECKGADEGCSEAHSFSLCPGSCRNGLGHPWKLGAR